MKKLLVLAAVILTLGLVACSDSDPGPTGPDFDYVPIGALILDQQGRPIVAASVTIDTEVDSKGGLSPDTQGLTPPVEMAVPQKFLDDRPWKVRYRVRPPVPCGPTSAGPCFEPIDDLYNVDWATEPRYGKYLRATIEVKLTAGS